MLIYLVYDILFAEIIYIVKVENRILINYNYSPYEWKLMIYIFVKNLAFNNDINTLKNRFIRSYIKNEK